MSCSADWSTVYIYIYIDLSWFIYIYLLYKFYNVDSIICKDPRSFSSVWSNWVSLNIPDPIQKWQNHAESDDEADQTFVAQGGDMDTGQETGKTSRSMDKLVTIPENGFGILTLYHDVFTAYLQLIRLSITKSDSFHVCRGWPSQLHPPKYAFFSPAKAPQSNGTVLPLTTENKIQTKTIQNQCFSLGLWDTSTRSPMGRD